MLKGIAPEWKELSNTWLISDIGWSVYLPMPDYTCDPYMVDRYRIVLVNGTPVVHGERRKKIVDGLTYSTVEKGAIPDPLPTTFDMAKDLSETTVTQQSVSTDHGAFSVTIKLSSLWGLCHRGL